MQAGRTDQDLVEQTKDETNKTKTEVELGINRVNKQWKNSRKRSKRKVRINQSTNFPPPPGWFSGIPINHFNQ